MWHSTQLNNPACNKCIYVFICTWAIGYLWRQVLCLQHSRDLDDVWHGGYIYIPFLLRSLTCHTHRWGVRCRRYACSSHSWLWPLRISFCAWRFVILFLLLQEDPKFIVLLFYIDYIMLLFSVIWNNYVIRLSTWLQQAGQKEGNK